MQTRRGIIASGAGLLVAGCASAPPAAKRCPVCAKEFLDGSVFCTEDGAGLVAVAVTAPAVVAPKVRICPRCQRRYEPLMDFCVDDGERLKDG